MKNHEARPAGVAPFPEVNASQHNHFRKARGRGRGRGHAHNYNENFKNPSFHQKWKNNEKNEGKGGQSGKASENICYRCGGKGQWSRTCHTPKHLVDLYQQSIKNNEKRVETNYGDCDEYDGYGDMDPFFEDPNRKIDHLIRDETVKK